MDTGACGLLLTMFYAEFRIYQGWKTTDTFHGLPHWEPYSSGHSLSVRQSTSII